MGFSRLVKRNLLDHFFSKGTFTLTTDFYVGVSLTEPSSVGTNITEPTDSSYARQYLTIVDFDATADEDPVVITNNTEINYAQATEDWFSGQDIPYVVLFDALTVGNMVMYGSYARAKPIYSNDILTIEVGKLLISLV